VNQTGSPAQALAIDLAGDVYVTGFTQSADFPVAHPYQGASKSNTWTAFVSALNPSGTALLYSTYLGGSVYTEGNSVVWDSHDNALYVVGTTNSPDFPITAGAFQTILSPNEVGVKEVSAGQYNAFVAKFSPSGQLTNSTFLGGNYPTTGFGVTTDPQGRAYVVGFTEYNCIPPDSASYSCFPTTPGAVIPAGTVSQNGNGFVSVFDPELSTLLYSTLLGDPNGAETNTSEAFGVAVDPSGNFYVVGVTGSPSLPTTPGAFQPKLGASNAIPLVGFAAKFGPVSASGASLTYLTYLEATGVSTGDLPGGVVADSQGNAYIGGYTNSGTFP
jgi:Beta-propeller repeat